MKPIRSLEELQDLLDQEMGWRVKEITFLKFEARKNSANKKTFIRAGIALSYAHWEGFVKRAAEYYINFVQHRFHSYRQLASPFAVMGLKRDLSFLSNSKQMSANIKAYEFISNNIDSQANISLSNSINTESNLRSPVFINIAMTIGLSIEKYETKFNLIDKELVDRRNGISHGDYIDINGSNFNDIANEVLVLLRDFKTDIENSASTKSYLK